MPSKLDSIRERLADYEAAVEWRVRHKAVLAAYKNLEADDTREAYEAVKVAQTRLLAVVAALTENGG